jgi:uncharacterized protein
MAEYLAPGVYTEEIDTGPVPIEGVSTSTAGFVGVTVRGPLDGLPTLVTSMAEFTRRFGGYFDFGPAFAAHRTLPFAVDGFFANGGRRVYVMRVFDTAAVAANGTVAGGVVTRLIEDAPLGQNKIKVSTTRGIHVAAGPVAATKVMLRQVKDSITTDSAVLDVTAIDRANNILTLSANLAAVAGMVSYDRRYTTVFTDIGDPAATGIPTALATPTAARPASVALSASSRGSWGNDLDIRAFHESAARSDLDAFVSGANNDNKLRLRSAAGFYVNAWVEITRSDDVKLFRKVTAIAGNVITVDGQALVAGDYPAAPPKPTVIATCEFRLAISYQPQPDLPPAVETFSGLTLENVPGRYVIDRVNNASDYISVGLPLPATHPIRFPSADDGVRLRLTTSGTDGGAPTDAAYVGTDPGPGLRTGLRAMEDIDQVSILAVPGITSQTVQNALIEQCERLKDRFAILDPAPKGTTAPDLPTVIAQRQLYDTKYAALYYPRVLVPDQPAPVVMPPNGPPEIAIGPSGHVAGLYARTDIERGVFKAPANEVLRSILDVEVRVNKGEHDILNPPPNQINVIRDFRDSGRGIRVYGARCITSLPQWKYVNVRRLFIFLEESLDEGLQWVVFEPNDERLWARVVQSVSSFLTRVWRDGALMGTKREHAYFVRCDRTTMTQDDIDNGRLILLIGVAPVKPAEFVIIRIGQWAGGSSVDEL